MYTFKDLTSQTLQGIVLRIKKKYKNEGVYEFYISFLKDSVNDLINRYNNGEGLKSLAKEQNISYACMKFIFNYNNVKLRNHKERMFIVNTQIIPKLMKEKYGVENIFKAEMFKQKLKEFNLKKYGCEHISQVDEIKK